MQSRRHLGVAAVAVAAQLVSLAVATDILGADVSDYATQFETIEAVGMEPDVGPAPPGIGPDGQPSQTDQDQVEPIDVADEADQTVVDEADQSDEVLAGGETIPDQPALVDEMLDRPVSDGDDGDGSVGTSIGATEPDPLTEAAGEPVLPIAAARPDDTATVDATSSTRVPHSSSETSSTTTAESGASTGPGSTASTTTTTTGILRSTSTASAPSIPPRPRPTVAPVAIDSGERSTLRSAAASTTWLPATTNRPITTWATTTTTAAATTVPAQAATTAAPTVPASTTGPPTTAVSTTKPPTTVVSTSAPPTTQKPTGGSSDNAGLAAMSNTDPRFGRYASLPSNALSLEQLTEPAPAKDNGTVGDGQFRAACQYSHFAYDDPIVFPGQPGRSHLHMFFGNTETNAFSTTDSIVNSGGGSCNGFELNRSAYWTPAVLDGQGNAVVPDMIILYYKTKEPGQVQRMPQGLKMVSGNTAAESFTVSDFLYWSCGDSGRSYNKSNRIPDCNGDTVNATISFPQCWDGRNMDSADHRSHMALVSPHKPCPSTHPVRLPQISILLYFPGQPSTKGWYLSSDRGGSFNTGPGATLHADWWGGWNDQTMDLWTNGCMKAARNCSFGQTGTNRQLAKLNNFQNYQGPNFVPLP